MKQIIQNYRTGEVEVAEVPIPLCPANKVLVRNVCSLVSIGTERSIVELGRKSLLGKARARPDLVKRFLEKARKEGVVKTFSEALERLDNATTLGYSSSGIVVEVGKNVHIFSPGDRVACIGAGYASHAEYITVPENLCSKMPDKLAFQESSFGMLGIIALHGIRSARLTFGETVAVIGLGLLGILTVQILKAYGCRVIGLDIDPFKVDLAKQLGADYAFTSEEEFKDIIERITTSYGADAVIITAATKSSAPVHTAVDIARHSSRIVLVGVADIHPHRNEMWHKEVEIIVSKAGGPGIFDPFYESKGIDYPIGYVRWTEGRNLEEFVRLVTENKVDVKPLISHRVPIDKAEVVYKDMLAGTGGPYTGVVIDYPERDKTNDDRLVRLVELERSNNVYLTSNMVSLGVIGAGLFGKSLLLPAMRGIGGVRFHTLSTSSGANTYHTAKKYSFENCATDYKEVLENKDINAVMILTPHSLHAKMVIEALKAGKHIFVEKPLCITEDELVEIENTYSELHPDLVPILMVGYNRRFSPHAREIKKTLDDRKDPLVMHYRVNAGFVPSDHWVHSEEEGGSRIIGEICHFVDFLQFVVGSDPIRVFAERISGNNKTSLNSDNISITFKFKDGSLGTITYSASGDRAFSREYCEIFCEGKVITLTDFRLVETYERGKKRRYKTYNQAMGYREEICSFIHAVKGGVLTGISPHDIFTSTRATLKINESLAKNHPVAI